MYTNREVWTKIRRRVLTGELSKRAIEFFGAVPCRIRYDKLKFAVAKITGSRDRKVTLEFQGLMSHYLLEAHFCLDRRLNERGHVERLLDFAPANFLVPVLQVKSLQAPYEQLPERCEQDLQRQRDRLRLKTV